MGEKKRNFVDKMVDVFGYDYVIGFCLCSEYDLKGRAKREEDKEKADKLLNIAKTYASKAEQLIRERIENGL